MRCNASLGENTSSQEGPDSATEHTSQTSETVLPERIRYLKWNRYLRETISLFSPLFEPRKKTTGYTKGQVAFLSNSCAAPNLL